jgi:hypothetical protein
MANRNKRTKSRREKEVKEAQHKKVAEKPIHKRPWIWIALAALVIGIVVPSAYQYNEKVKSERETARLEQEAKQAVEPIVWDAVLAPLAEMGVSESAITNKSFDIGSTAGNGELDFAQVSITTDVRTIVAAVLYQSQSTVEIDGSTDGAVSEPASQWMCLQITNEAGDHVYWTIYQDESQQMYNYFTDEALPTGPAIQSPDTTDAAVETSGDAVETSGDAVETSGDAVETTTPDAATGPAAE